VFDAIYEFLAKIGYSHPIHPPIPHVPVGMIIGGLLFAVIAIPYQKPSLVQSARNCMILGLISLLPTAISGYMDWQYYYAGAWLDAIIIKLVLTGVLVVLLIAAVILGRKGRAGSKVVLATYTLAFLAVVVLGYYGGELAFGGRTVTAPPEYQAGENIYKINCSACHPQGGNIVNPNLSVLGAPQLIDFDTFLTYSRNPQRPGAVPGLMPPVLPTKLSDQQLKEVFDYITKVLERPRRKME
jgi:uncharacterized membrane protein